mgnify:CR=1 FL=1
MPLQLMKSLDITWRMCWDLEESLICWDIFASMMEIMLGGNYKEESSGKLVF